MYKVGGSVKTEIDITEDEMLRIVRNYVCSKFKWKDTYFIEDDWVCDIVDYATSHHWSVKEQIRKVTALDKALYTVFKELTRL